MKLTDFITPERVVDELDAEDKATALDELSRLAADTCRVSVAKVIAALEVRENLGSTGMGQGIAIPHAKIEGLKDFVGFFARLKQPIDFASVDGKPVDLIFLLLIPASCRNNHVSALAAISRRFREADIPSRLRSAKGLQALYNVLAGTAD